MPHRRTFHVFAAGFDTPVLGKDFMSDKDLEFDFPNGLVRLGLGHSCTYVQPVTGERLANFLDVLRKDGENAPLIPLVELE